MYAQNLWKPLVVIFYFNKKKRLAYAISGLVVAGSYDIASKYQHIIQIWLLNLPKYAKNTYILH